MAIHKGTSGSNERKRKVAFASFLAMVVAAIVWGQWKLMERQDHEARLRWEEDRVIEFVQHQPQFQAIGGTPTMASISTYKITTPDPMPSEYDVHIDGDKELHVIVRINRRVKPIQFTILCTTRLSVGERDPTKPTCAQ